MSAPPNHFAIGPATIFGVTASKLCDRLADRCHLDTPRSWGLDHESLTRNEILRIMAEAKSNWGVVCEVQWANLGPDRMAGILKPSLWRRLRNKPRLLMVHDQRPVSLMGILHNITHMLPDDDGHGPGFIQNLQTVLAHYVDLSPADFWDAYIMAASEVRTELRAILTMLVERTLRLDPENDTTCPTTTKSSLPTL